MSPPSKLGYFHYRQIGEVVLCDYYYDSNRAEWVLVQADKKPLYILVRVLEPFNRVLYWAS